MIKEILKHDPSASLEKAEIIAVVWSEVVDSIIREMLDRAAVEMSSLHIDLREEMVLELARLISYLSAKVVSDRMSERAIEDIDPWAEREQCFNSAGRERISVTAKNFADRVWLKIYNERWRPKTESALRKEKSRKRTIITPKQVEENHFIPKSFIKKYWSEGQFVYKTSKWSGRHEKIKTPVGSWGFRLGLY